MSNILIADDEKEIVKLLKIYLKTGEYTVLEAYDGQQALEILNTQPVDLAIIDIMMPKINGYQLIEKIRSRQNKYIPVIVISAKGTLSDRILGIDLGADDYITKPFEPLEILSKVNAQFRRINTVRANTESDNITIGDISLNLKECNVTKNDQIIELTKSEFKVLELMMQHPKRVFTKDQIYESAWYDAENVDENTIRVIISRLRDKIGNEHIKTIRGLGYRYEQ